MTNNLAFQDKPKESVFEFPEEVGEAGRDRVHQALIDAKASLIDYRERTKKLQEEEKESEAKVRLEFFNR